MHLIVTTINWDRFWASVWSQQNPFVISEIRMGWTNTSEELELEVTLEPARPPVPQGGT